MHHMMPQNNSSIDTTAIEEHINNENIHLSASEKQTISGVPYLASFVNSKMEEIERDYYSKEEIDNKAFIDASYIDDNCLVNEEYVYNTLQGYVKNSDLNNSVLDILNNSNLNMEVNSTPVTINGYKINLLKEGNELSLSIYTPISVAVNSTIRVHYQTTSKNVTFNFTITGGTPSYSYKCFAAGALTYWFNPTTSNTGQNCSYTINVIPDQQKTYKLYCWDRNTEDNKTVTNITILPTYTCYYSTSPMETFTGATELECANKNEVQFTTTTTGDQCTYFACPRIWGDVLFANNGGFDTRWEKVSGTYVANGLNYDVYKSNSGLGTANYTLK